MEQVFSLAEEEEETTGREKSSDKVYVYNEIPLRTFVVMVIISQLTYV